MRKVGQFVAIALGLTLMLTAGAAMAQKDRGMHGMQQGQGMQRGYGQGYGQMDPEKMQQMRDIQADYAEEMYELRSQLFAKQQELSAAMAGERVNEEQARSLVSEINDLRGELFSQRMEMRMEMRQQGLMSPYGGYGMMGPGMMGQGMMHGGGYGMGPGMMGSGMMHGRGMGPGMRHRGMGRGMGPGMMYGCPYQNY